VIEIVNKKIHPVISQPFRVVKLKIGL